MNSGGSDGHGLKNKIKRASAGIVKVSLLAQLTAAAILAMGLMTSVLVPSATAQQVGSVTGLPLPRYVSLKSDRINLREGPSKEHRTVWLFQRAGLPVEITAEFDTWRKIRDSEGSEGWVLHSLLSGRRTVLAKRRGTAALQPGVRHGRCGGQPANRRDFQRQTLRSRLVPHLRLGLRRLHAAKTAVGRLSRREGRIIGRTH